MPTKDLKEVKLYFCDEEGKPIGSVEHIEEILLNGDDTQDEPFPFHSTQEFSANLDSLCTKYLLVAIGEKRCVPNNWLKRHGIPMNRRK